MLKSDRTVGRNAVGLIMDLVEAVTNTTTFDRISDDQVGDAILRKNTASDVINRLVRMTRRSKYRSTSSYDSIYVPCTDCSYFTKTEKAILLTRFCVDRKVYILLPYLF